MRGPINTTLPLVRYTSMSWMMFKLRLIRPVSTCRTCTWSTMSQATALLYHSQRLCPNGRHLPCPSQQPLARWYSSPETITLGSHFARQVPSRTVRPGAAHDASENAQRRQYCETGGVGLAGREGFEPSTDFSTCTHLAGGRTKPSYATSPCSIYADGQGGGRGIRTPGTARVQLFSRQPP